LIENPSLASISTMRHFFVKFHYEALFESILVFKKWVSNILKLISK
jgi:hypothetical protein